MRHVTCERVMSHREHMNVMCVYVCAFVHARMCVLFVRKHVQADVSSDRYDWTREMMKWDKTQIALTEIVMIYESCHMWTSHVTHMNTWMLLNAGDNEMRQYTNRSDWNSHDEWVVSHVNESCHTDEHKNAANAGNDEMRQHINRSDWNGHDEWVMSHVRHVTHMNTWMNHVPCERVMSHTWTHVWVISHVNVSCHTHEHVNATERGR